MLNQDVDHYLALRRAAGFELKVQAGLLRHFACYAAERSETHVRRQTAINWAAQAPSPYQRENRLTTVRVFARHARAEDPRHELIPRRVFAGGRRRTLSYIFSPGELRQLLEATARLRPRGSLRPHTYYTLFGLLAVTGLRISEAMRLRLDDVAADSLLVRMTKFRKTRWVPFHPSTGCVLERYLEHRNAFASDDDHVFISHTGQPLSYAMINGTFHYLVRSLQLEQNPDAPQPRIHNLRHGFAVRALERCQGTADDVARHTLALSTYLGHAHVADTYAYAFQLLLHFASQRRSTTPSALQLEHIDAPLVLQFLEYLQRVRSNVPRTRNARLTAIKSFMHFIEYQVPSALEQVNRVLAIPNQKTDIRLVEHLIAEQCQAILDNPAPSTRLGIRDRAMLHVSITAGLRVSELVDLRLADVSFESRYLNLHVCGKAMTRAGFEYLLRKHATEASQQCPSLRDKRIAPHMLRHTCALNILQATGDIRKVALWLGHESIQTTEDYLRVDVTQRIGVLHTVTPPQLRPGKFRPPDKLIATLRG